MGPRIVEGRRVKGFGVGGRYVGHPYYGGWFERLLGCRPFPGTLNVEASVDWRELAGLCEPVVVPETVWEGQRLGAVYVWRARLRTREGPVEVLIIRPLLSGHGPRVLELVACSKLAPLLDSDRVELEILCSGA
ncbi:DUF120 domain-containing protein [Pyrodictium abyssi]|uniref:Riboflavin kinase n=1 Tax=Pyrodictium abyssi TaxID=54256 RepID=A0ABN6ZTC4_9CREN|nr:hypothetical protein PABY_15050 [Pyrodictium abyssi]